MTSVLVVGDVPRLTLTYEAGFEVLTTETLDDDAARLTGLQSEESLLIVLPTWLPAPLRAKVATLARVRTAGTVLVNVDLPPLAVAAVAAGVATRATQTGDLGALADEARIRKARVSSMAWLSSVTKLERPAPTVAQHAKSLLRRSSWLAEIAPEPRVIIAESEPGTDEGASPAAPINSVVYVADGGGDRPWVDSFIARRFPGARPPVPVQPVPSSADYWGGASYVELAVVPPPLPAAPLAPCEWCGCGMGLPVCDVCGMSLTSVDLTMTGDHSSGHR